MNNNLNLIYTLKDLNFILFNIFLNYMKNIIYLLLNNF